MAIGLGCGTTANQPAARQAFQRSADQNSGLGEAAYGLALWLGEGGPQLKDEAKTYLQKSVDANNPFGEFIMSIYTPDLKIGEDLDAKAAPFFAPAENSLDVFRKFKPTSEHEIDPSLSEAFNQGDLMAGRNIGSSYFGLREFTASTQAWKNALAAPNKMIAWPSMTSSLASQVLQPLGVNFRFGLGGPPSDEEAAGYFERSTDISASALELAWMYEHGQGVPRSRSKALHLYRLAAAEGSFAANAHLRALNTNP